MSERVDVRIENHVAEVVLNRPDKFNALDVDMFHALVAAARSVADEKSVRAVVLHGAGENFCAGIDIDALKAGAEELTRALLAPVEGSPANIAQQAAYAWRALAVPVICALQGFAFGGGFQIAMGADLRYATPTARFSIMESKWGLIPDMAISTTVRDLVPADRIKELAFTARVFDAQEALGLGLITGIEDDPLAAARTMAEMIAARSPDAMRGIKRLVNEAWSRSEADALTLEMAIQKAILVAPNQAEAVLANLTKREAKFVD